MPRRDENAYGGTEFTDWRDEPLEPDVTVREAVAEALQYRNGNEPTYYEEEMEGLRRLMDLYEEKGLERTREMEQALGELEMRSNALGWPDGQYDDFPKGEQVTQHYRELLKPALEFDDLSTDTGHELRQLVYGMNPREAAEFDDTHAKLYQAMENGECSLKVQWDDDRTIINFQVEEGIEPDRIRELNQAASTMEKFIRDEKAVAIPLQAGAEIRPRMGR